MVATTRTVVELGLAPDPRGRRGVRGLTPPSAVAGAWAALVGLVVIVILTGTPAAGPDEPTGAVSPPCLPCDSASRYDADTFADPPAGPQRMGSP
ncbi:hypothetical protein [Cellulomonas sp. PhB150]|uniref:hypothetical protein n=1 Tax=Cellulomonas sp. PhB150 TaxID=2485188 RepID=UPI000F49C98B|nr:hypothetical protein [Cellulomonas sp. PhB150]ROS31708.1 hypothetical protein EDF34_1371 [Cellulomonas sp. PhB150]